MSVEFTHCNMEPDADEVLREGRVLTKLTQRVERDMSEFTSLRQDIIEAAERVIIAARGGGEHLYWIANETTRSSALRCAISLKVFELLTPGSTITAEQIADANNADRQLIVRIMRALTSTYIFNEISEETYAHNALSLAFVPQQHQDLFKTTYDITGKACYALPGYLEGTGWCNIENYNDCAFQYAHQTSLGMWEWMQENSARMEVFNSAMQSNANTPTQVDFPYPFAEKLHARPTGDGEVVLVDVGGGRGHTLQRMKSAFPDLKGRLILQDQESVINDAVSHGIPDYIEAQAHSFFTPNPVKRARAYYFRRIFHDWSDKVSLDILKNVVCSMGPHSKVLISDNILPDTGAHWSAALPDLRMMASIAGIERTRRQWQELLMQAGLGSARFWQAKGSSFGIVEAEVALPDRSDVGTTSAKRRG